MKKITIMLLLLGIVACSDDEKATDIYLGEFTNGAFLRTVEYPKMGLDISNLNDMVRLTLEEQDIEDGGLIDNVSLEVRFIDRTPDSGTTSTSFMPLATLEPNSFSTGPFGLPRVTVDFSLESLLNAVQLSQSNVNVKDQFEIRLLLTLTDGRSFGRDNSSYCIRGFKGFYSAPFGYIVTLIEPIEDELFTGTYVYSSILDGIQGPVFGPSHEVEITNGEFPNEREILFQDVLGIYTGRLKTFQFMVGGDEVFWRNNQIKTLLFRYCGPIGQPILLFPAEENATINLKDDSVFEIWIEEDFWDDIPSTPTRIQFTKQ